MNTGKNCDSQRDIKGQWQKPGEVIKSVCRQEKNDHYNLNKSIHLAGKRRAKTAESSRHIDDQSAQHYENIATDRRCRQPERDRWRDGETRKRQNDECRHQKQFISHRVQYRAKLRFLVECARNQSVQSIGDGGGEEYAQRPIEILIVSRRDKDGN